MKKFDDDTFLARWLSNELSPEERTAFEDSDEYAAYQKIAKGASLFTTPNSLNEEKLLEEVNTLKHHTANTNSSIKRRYWLYGMAATIALLITSYFMFDLITYSSYSADYGETETVLLPDGTEVILNARSEISLQRWNWKDNRRVNLEGQAFFKVVKGSTFTVESNHGSVTVLGTQFDVKAMYDFIEVNCYEGSVRVNTLLHEQTLTPGNGFRQIYADTTLINTEGIKPSWMGHESVYESIPARYILQDLENQYNIYFEGRLPDDLLFTGSFPHDNQDLALKIVLGALEVQYQIRQNNVIELVYKK